MRSGNSEGMVRGGGGTPVVGSSRGARGEHFRKRVGSAAAGAPAVKEEQREEYLGFTIREIVRSVIILAEQWVRHLISAVEEENGE